jgi:hypothetical protein
VICTVGINYTQVRATNISVPLFSYLGAKGGAPAVLDALTQERYACAVALAAYNRNFSKWTKPLQTDPRRPGITHGSRNATSGVTSLATTANAVGNDFILLMTNLSPFITTAQWSKHANTHPWACRALLGAWPSHLHVSRLLRFLSKRVDLWVGHSSIYGTDWVWPEFSSYKAFRLQSWLLTGNISCWGARSMASAFSLRTHSVFPLYGGARRLSNKVEKIIDAAIKKIYLTAERPDVAAVVEEVNLQCFNSKIKGKPAPNTIRARVSVLSARAGASARRNRSRRRAADQHRSSPFSSRLERNALVR